MFTHKSTDIHKAKQSWCSTIASMKCFRGDRDADTTKGRRRIAWLESLVYSGEFIPPRWSLAELDGEWYRVDGAHSSKMLSALPPSDFPRNLIVVLDRFRCETNEDFATLFHVFNPQESVRTYTDEIKAHKHTVDSLLGTSDSAMRKVLAGVSLFDKLASGTAVSRRARLSYIHTDGEFMRWAGSFASCTGKVYCNSAIIASAYAMFLVNEDQADEFWSATRSGCEELGNATRTLGKFIETEAFVRGKNTGSRRWSNRAVYCKCVHAWNAWRKDATTVLRYSNSAALSEAI